MAFLWFDTARCEEVIIFWAFSTDWLRWLCCELNETMEKVTKDVSTKKWWENKNRWLSFCPKRMAVKRLNSERDTGSANERKLIKQKCEM